jgi:nucleoside-diphosphate-sugar epimerase
METIMVTGGLGFTGRHITKRLAAGGHRVVSYNREFAPRSHRADRRRVNASSAGEPVGASGPQDRM